MNVTGLVIMKGEEYMMYLHENLKDKALKLVDLKETKDDIKVSMDLGQISIMMSSESNSQEFVQAGMELDQRLKREYPEIQMLCNAANAMRVSGDNHNQMSYISPGEGVKAALKTDCFGILSGVLIKHNVISDFKEFIRSVD